MRKRKLLLLFSLVFMVGISYGAEVNVPSGDTLQNFIDAAADGDVLILENGGVYYTFGSLEVDKSLTLKAADGYTVRPQVYCDGTSGVLISGKASVTEIGIEFISTAARYLNRIDKNDTAHFIGMFDCVARGFDRNIIQSKDNPSFLDSCIVEDSYAYAGGGGGYSFINCDDASLRYLRLTNSSFVDFDKSFIELHKRTDEVKTVIIENCNIHGRASSAADLIRIHGAAGSVFTIKNSIISGIELEGIWDIGDNVTDTIMNVYYHDVFDEAGMTGNTWSHEVAFTKTDPEFTNGPVGALYLRTGSPALTASTTGSYIGASRWITAPAADALLGITINGQSSVLNPAFHIDSLDYTADIPFKWGDTVEVAALAAYSEAVITGDGKKAWDGAMTLAVDVSVEGGTNAYHLDLTRIEPNDDPTLHRIVIQDTIPDKYYIYFPGDQPDWNEFDLRFPVGMDTLNIIKAEKNWDGTEVSYEQYTNVQSGSEEIKIYCTAETGKTLTYTINAMTEGTGTDATLRKMLLRSSVDTFATTPPFDSGITNYTLNVPYGTDMVYVEAIATDSYSSIDDTSFVETEVAITDGGATATVTVTSEDGATSETYTVTITESPTSVDYSFVNNIRLYHNSADEMLNIINAKDVKQVQIYSITGKMLINKTVTGQETLEISTSNLANGLFIVKLNNINNQFYTNKFIK